jgi:DNA invertase Pin-like site-specific DNA recombinase
MKGVIMNNNGTYKVGIYLRLSREDDLSDESKSITHQREIATEYCIQNGFRIVKEYVDDGVSGATDDRPKFQELITDIENKNIDLVITKDTSRLARNYATFTYYVLEYFPSKNVRYIFINDKIDSLKKDTINEGTLCMAFFNELQVRRDSTKIKDSLNSSKRQ